MGLPGSCHSAKCRARIRERLGETQEGAELLRRAQARLKENAEAGGDENTDDEEQEDIAPENRKGENIQVVPGCTQSERRPTIHRPLR